MEYTWAPHIPNMKKRKGMEEFKEARKIELSLLLLNGIVKVLNKERLPVGERIYRTHFVDAYKTVEGMITMIHVLVVTDGSAEIFAE